MSSLIDTAVEYLEVFCQPDLDSSSVYTSQLLQAYLLLAHTCGLQRRLLISSGATLLILEDHKCLGIYLTYPSWCPATDGFRSLLWDQKFVPLPPQNLYIEALTPNMNTFGDGDLMRKLSKCSINGGALIR